MKFFKTIAECFRKYFSIAGVASRSQFWFWILFVAIVLAVASIIDGAIIAPAMGFLAFDQDAGSPLSVGAFALLLIPTITVTIRRFHESGKSAWWVLFSLISIVAGFFLVSFLLTTMPASIRSAISSITSPEVLYLVGFLPLFYFLVKKGLGTNNRYL